MILIEIWRMNFFKDKPIYTSAIVICVVAVAYYFAQQSMEQVRIDYSESAFKMTIFKKRV